MIDRQPSPQGAPLDAWRDKVLPLRRRWAEKDRLLEERLDALLPGLMARESIDCWIVVASEYNEDPVFDTLTPSSMLNASRRTILLLHRRGDGSVERAVAGPYPIGKLYAGIEVAPQETREAAIRRFVEERDPRTIGIDISSNVPLADGLSHTGHAWLMDLLGPELASRTKSAEGLVVGWLETRTPSELAAYPGLVDLTRALIRTAFSPLVITPGVTTAEDVVWWMHQRVEDLGLEPAFPFTVSIDAEEQPFDIHHRDNERNRILPGDTLRCDVGVTTLGLTTDLQESVYILKPGETEPPTGLRQAMAAANRAQDLVAASMALGRTGNDILAEARRRAEADGLDACVFCHPIGAHVHGAGTMIGRWDCQDPLPGLGKHALHNDTCYAIELYVKRPVPEWGDREFMMVLEQDAAFVDGAFRWLSGRQTRFLTI